MRHFSLFVLVVAVALATAGCTDPQTQAVNNLRSYYEELSYNSDHYTTEEWEAFMQEYAYNDSLINTYQYTPEELQEINDLRGRCSAYLLKGAAKEIGNELDKALNGFGSFMNGLLDEFSKDKDNK